MELYNTWPFGFLFHKQASEVGESRPSGGRTDWPRYSQTCVWAASLSWITWACPAPLCLHSLLLRIAQGAWPNVISVPGNQVAPPSSSLSPLLFAGKKEKTAEAPLLTSCSKIQGLPPLLDPTGTAVFAACAPQIHHPMNAWKEANKSKMMFFINKQCSHSDLVWAVS